MSAHVFRLCANNLISIVFVKPHLGFRANPEGRTVLIQPIRSTITYVAALHELGHVLDRQALTAKDILRCEALAWRWAQKQAIVWNATATKHRDACLKAYLTAEGRPADNSVFWKVYRS